VTLLDKERTLASISNEHLSFVQYTLQKFMLLEKTF
jgi:hypothetical protein